MQFSFTISSISVLGNILFKFNGSNAGVTLTSADEKNNDFLYLIMPMRLR